MITYKLTISALAVLTATSNGVLPRLSAIVWSALLFSRSPTCAGRPNIVFILFIYSKCSFSISHWKLNLPNSVASNKAVLPALSLVLILAPFNKRNCKAVLEPCEKKCICIKFVFFQKTEKLKHWISTLWTARWIGVRSFTLLQVLRSAYNANALQIHTIFPVSAPLLSNQFGSTCPTFKNNKSSLHL